MGLTHFPHGVASFGVPVLGSGPVFTTGNVFFVDSGSANAQDANTHGKDPIKPFSTYDYAIGKCTANNGDHIILMPGHTETISAAGGVTVDVAGVTAICLGSGASRATMSFTATASTYVVTAADHVLVNALCTGDIDAVVTMFSISGADCKLIDLETQDVTGQMVSCITTATGADRLLIDRPIHRGAAAAGGANYLEVVGADDGVTIKDFWIDGNFSAAAIQNVTGVATNLNIYGDKQCFIRNRNSADIAITCVATSTGNIGPNINIRLADNAANIDECLVGAAMQFYHPMQIVNADGEAPFGTTAVGGIGGSNKTASTDV